MTAMFNDPPVRTEALLALFRTVQRRLLLVTAAVTVLGVGVGALIAGMAGVWGGLLAAGLGLAFTLTTVAMLRFVAGRGPEILQLVLVGGWIVKIVLVVIVMLWLRDLHFYNRGVFFGTLVAVVIGAVVVEIGTVATTRLPHVEPTMPDAVDVSSLTRADGTAATDPDSGSDPQESAREHAVRPRGPAVDDDDSDADGSPEQSR